MNLDEISALLVEVAEQVILPRFGALAGDEVIEKKPGDLVTVADREAEALLTRILSAAHPGALVIGEEAVFLDRSALDELAEADHAWVIDPIDGTRNFAHGRADFAVMLAELRRGETVHGWIYQPVHQRMYVAEHGAGVSRDGDLLEARRPGRARPVGATYVNLPRGSEERLQVLRPWGSCGIDYPRLVEGRIDFLAYRSLHPWDHLPGGLMVREIGGRIATDEGVEYGPGVTGRRLVAACDVEVWRLARDTLFGRR